MVITMIMIIIIKITMKIIGIIITIIISYQGTRGCVCHDPLFSGKICLKGGVHQFLSKVMYRVFIKYCVFSLKFCDFSDLCQFYCSAGVVPACCVYTH